VPDKPKRAKAKRKSAKKKAENIARVVSLPETRQLSLFGQFWGDGDELSNTIEVWDAIPKYSVSARRQSQMRDVNGRLMIHEQRFSIEDRECRMEMRPALIRLSDGTCKDFYPSADEELTEEVLRKIFADQHHGRHDPAEGESWVIFSLQMIRKELKARGKTRSLDEIKRSLEILSLTNISFYVGDDDDPLYQVPILPDVLRDTRGEYIKDGTARCIAKLPGIISSKVNELKYRQLNYAKLMAMQSQLARWLQKLLTNRFLNAAWDTEYRILYSTIKQNSGLLEQKRVNENICALESALEELVEGKVLLLWKKEEKRGSRNKITDVCYNLSPHPDFTEEVKTANARVRRNFKELNS
jgi:hypothetical protein